MTPPGAVDVTVIDVAAHTAYLEPATGTGLLILPDPDAGLPTQDHVTAELDKLGWSLFEDEGGRVEIAGRTVDGRLAVCLCGDQGLSSHPTLAEIHRALIALRIAADLEPD